MNNDLSSLNIMDCPLCGGAPLLEEEKDWCFYVTCMDCGCHTADFSYNNPKERLQSAEKAVHTWNLGKVISSIPGE